MDAGMERHRAARRTTTQRTSHFPTARSTEAELQVSDQNQLYADTYSNTLADWSFKSWGTRLQTATDPNGVNGLKGTIQPTTDYDKATQTENFGKDSANKNAILERFWNPRYNPATWPHMVTYTIGFSACPTRGMPTFKPHQHGSLWL
jgi:hypothetical protein